MRQVRKCLNCGKCGWQDEMPDGYCTGCLLIPVETSPTTGHICGVTAHWDPEPPSVAEVDKIEGYLAAADLEADVTDRHVSPLPEKLKVAQRSLLGIAGTRINAGQLIAFNRLGYLVPSEVGTPRRNIRGVAVKGFAIGDQVYQDEVHQQSFEPLTLDTRSWELGIPLILPVGTKVERLPDELRQDPMDQGKMVPMETNTSPTDGFVAFDLHQSLPDLFREVYEAWERENRR